jgi:pimeloyl-ACP methyl ester carboxylesterase
MSLSSLNQQTAKYQRDKLYEKLAKPGKNYSVYSNKHYPGEVLLGEYQVEEIFQDKDSGFYALGLVSASGKNSPVLVIRGFGNWGRLEDFPREFFPYQDISDVVMTQSDSHFQAAKKIGVIEWLRNQVSKGTKPDVVGQSLGGKVAQQLAVEVPDYIDSLITFNSIGISSQEFEKYQREVAIFHYINPVDFVPYVLGDKFLPGTIFQVYNQTIKTPDFLGQHNNLVLDKPDTVIKEVKIESFYWVRELYQSIRSYRRTVQKEVEELNQIAKQDDEDYEASTNKSTQAIRQQFDVSIQAVQQEFNNITQAIRQELLTNTDGKSAAELLQQRVSSSVEVIQKEIEILSVTVQQEIRDSGRTFKSFSQRLKEELKDSVGMVKQKLEKLLQVETKSKIQQELDVKSDRT